MKYARSLSAQSCLVSRKSDQCCLYSKQKTLIKTPEPFSLVLSVLMGPANKSRDNPCVCFSRGKLTGSAFDVLGDGREVGLAYQHHCKAAIVVSVLLCYLDPRTSCSKRLLRLLPAGHFAAERYACRVWKGTGSQVDVILNKEAS